MRTLVFGFAVAALMLAPMASASADSKQDLQTAQRIADSMKQSGLLRDYRVGVKCNDGVVRLTGSVKSARQKAAAEWIARESAGTRRVVSKLVVESSEMRTTRQPRTDAGIRLVADNHAQSHARPVATRRTRRNNTPRPYARSGQGIQPASYGGPAMGGPGMGGGMGQPMPAGGGQAVGYDSPQMPNYAWPSYAANPNYAALTYPKQYSPSAWPYIGPFYPYPQVPLGWRKVTLEWDDGWWFLDFKDQR